LGTINNVCIVGAAGSIGRRHHRCLDVILPDADIILCDVVDGFINVNDVCKSKFDLVVVCTPSSKHIDVASKFINSDSFFIEKPLDSNIEVIRDNLDFFENKKTMVSCNLMFSKHMKIVEKNLPNCLFASVKCHTFLPMWRADYKNLYSSSFLLGGGIFNDAIHDIHYVYQILGIPKNIFVVRRRLADYTIDTDDYSMIIFDYGNKIINIELSYLCREKQRTCDMTFGNGRRMVVDFASGLSDNSMCTVSDIDETYAQQWKYFLSTDSPINSYSYSLKMLDNLANCLSVDRGNL